MFGATNIEAVYAVYRDGMAANYSGKDMLQFLDSVKDVLQTKLVYYSISHLHLCVSLASTYSEIHKYPSIVILTSSDGYVTIEYNERWRDGRYMRGRQESIRCQLQFAGDAFLEFLPRLKAEETR